MGAVINMTSESSKALYSELFNTVLTELGGNFAGVAKIEKLMNETPNCIRVEALDGTFLPMKPFILGKFDIEVYQTVEIHLNYGSEDAYCPYHPVYIYIATDIKDLCKVIDSLQGNDRNWLVYFNGCDKTSVRLDIAQLNTHEKVFKAIWISTESRLSLKEMALYHSLKTQAVQIKTQGNKLKKQEVQLKLQQEQIELLMGINISAYVKKEIKLLIDRPGIIELEWPVMNNGACNWPVGCKAELSEGEAHANFQEIPPLPPSVSGTIRASLNSSGEKVEGKWILVTPNGKIFGVLKFKGKSSNVI